MAAAGSGGWTVTGQREDYRMGPDGQFASGVVVTFTSDKGSRGSVFVPDTEYTEGRVRELVTQRVASMDRVGSLTAG